MLMLALTEYDIMWESIHIDDSVIQKSQALIRDILEIPYSIYFACVFFMHAQE